MEVRCERCQTEYDFDDALISDRGTTVRCTTCGLEFQVFASTVHSDFVVTTEAGDVYHFASLAELQRAIIKGAVRESAVLRRGGDAPRTLGSIVELVPLLRQSRSVPPPPIESSSSGAAEPDSEAVPVHSVTRTRIGLPTVADLEKAGGRVPSKRMERPRIQSPLSVRPMESVPEAEVEPPSPRGKMPSLSDTLLGPKLGPSRSTPPPRAMLEADAADEYVEAPEPLPSSFPPPPASSARPPTLPPPSIAAARTVSAPSPKLPEMGGASSTLDDSSRSPRPSVQSATDLGRYAADAQAAQRLSGSLPSKPRARLAPLVFALLAGGAALFVYVSRERWRMSPTSSTPASGANETLKSEVTPSQLVRLEVESLRLRILGRERAVVAEEAKTLVPLLMKSGEKTPSMVLIDLLRLSGDTPGARKKLAERAASEIGASTTEEFPFSLAMLEIDDGTATPPWSIIVDRLRRAAQKENAPYLAQSTLVWAFVKAGRLDEAKAALVELKRLKDVGESPLLGPLVALLEGQNVGEPSVGSQHEVELAPVGIDAQTDEKPRPVGPEVKKLVSEADAFWAVGDRESALVLYRQIFRKVGPEHFLGQRATARIKQAERELAEKSGSGR